jgi:hypothetical protein
LAGRISRTCSAKLLEMVLLFEPMSMSALMVAPKDQVSSSLRAPMMLAPLSSSSTAMTGKAA